MMMPKKMAGPVSPFCRMSDPRVAQFLDQLRTGKWGNSPDGLPSNPYRSISSLERINRLRALKPNISQQIPTVTSTNATGRCSFMMGMVLRLY